MARDENVVVHINVDDTVKKLGIVQRSAFYTITGHRNKRFFKGVETDDLSTMKQNLHTILMTPNMDTIVIESIGKKMLICTMKRTKKTNEWEFEVEDETNGD